MSIDNMIVIVGYGSGHTRDLVRTIQEHGYKVLGVNEMWPRNNFICTGQGRYALGGLKDKSSTIFEGGYFVPGEGFILASDRLAPHLGPKGETVFSYEENVINPVEAHFRKIFPHLRVNAFPSGYYHGQKVEEHLDLYVMVLPKSKILIVDKYNKRVSQPGTIFTNEDTRSRIEAIAAAEGLELIWYDSSTENAWYPMNTLVLPTPEGRDFAVIDQEASGLIRILTERCIEFTTTPTSSHDNPSGKIHCATNHVFVVDCLAYKSPRKFLRHLGIKNITLNEKELNMLFKIAA